jgi:hypothetical protein
MKADYFAINEKVSIHLIACLMISELMRYKCDINVILIEKFESKIILDV